MRRYLILALVALMVVGLAKQSGAEKTAKQKPKSKPLHKLSQHTPLDSSRDNVRVDIWLRRNLGQTGFKSPMDGTPVDLLEFSGAKGDVISISVVSDDFDPLLWIMDAKRRVLIGGDDDNGAGSNAGITTVLPRRGSYVLAVNSYGKRGSYRVRIKKEPRFSIPAGSPRTKKRALLIGINDYPGFQSDLTAPAHDVDAVRKLLNTRAGFQAADILVIKDAYATYENIQDAVQSFLGVVPADGTVVFYFSGHGAQLEAIDGSERDGRDEALYLADGSFMSDNDLRKLLDCLPAEAITTIVDACHSGGIYRGKGQKSVLQKDVKLYLDLAATEPRKPFTCPDSYGRTRRSVNLVLTASQEDEKAWEWDEWEKLSTPRSIFTRFLVEEMGSSLISRSGISLKSMVKKIARETTTYAEDELSKTQTPRMINFLKREPRIHDLLGIKE